MLFLLITCMTSIIGLISIHFFSPNYQLFGNSILLCSMMTAWMMINPYSQIYLFQSIHIKTKWLILGYIAYSLYDYFNSTDWIGLISLTTSCIVSYFYSLLIWKGRSHFSFLEKFESKILSLRKS